MPAIAPPSIEELMGPFTVCIDIAILYVPTLSLLLILPYSRCIDAKSVWDYHRTDIFFLVEITGRLEITSLLSRIQTVHTLFCMDISYHYTIVDFGNIEGEFQIFWSAGAKILVEVLILFDLAYLDIEQKIYGADPHTVYLALHAHRVRVGNSELPLGTWAEFRELNVALIVATFFTGSSGVLDALIALSQIYYLWTSRTGYLATDTLVRKLMAYIINTGALTMCVTIAIIVTFWAPALKSSLLFAGLVDVQSKLYANSLIAMLNARQDLGLKAGRQHSSNLVEIGLHNVSRGLSRSQNIEIFRDTTEITDHDLSKSSTSGKD
ncbi:uncharacterized protein FIBRA_09496 [Fibroporia radiculosa]|uniref:DUF6534 domain-containing protein n=1 Tax=Fibroporia radiculosa TaxID=599839 RepID=J7SD40_9APHY|nr:uncharacterized protein FIBRA_09496 [Fibroporia radiculosa]CCM07158.1 predicted protein [Fibroporia radiculosa]